jgi:hypothetical protein
MLEDLTGEENIAVKPRKEDYFGKPIEVYTHRLYPIDDDIDDTHTFHRR